MAYSTARGIGIIIPEQITILHSIGGILLKNGINKIAGQSQACRDNKFAIRVQYSGEKILFLAYERRHCGSGDQRFHLTTGGVKHALDQLYSNAGCGVVCCWFHDASSLIRILPQRSISPC